jgi:hypothetical protein
LAGWFCRRGSLLLREGDRRRKENSNNSSNKAFHSFSPGGLFEVEPGATVAHRNAARKPPFFCLRSVLVGFKAVGWDERLASKSLAEPSFDI